MERPVVGVEPLRTKSLSTLFPGENFIRVCRPSDRFWHRLDLETIVVFEGGVRLLDSEAAAVNHINQRSVFLPESRADAELVLLSLAELCGYQVTTAAPPIPNWIQDRKEKIEKTAQIDWTCYWKNHPDGWEVSFVLMTSHANANCSRYTLVITKHGRLIIREAKPIFYTHVII